MRQPYGLAHRSRRALARWDATSPIERLANGLGDGRLAAVAMDRAEPSVAWA